MKGLVVFLSLIASTSCFSQYTKNWVVTGLGKVLVFQNSHTLKIDSFASKKVNFSSGGDLISSSNGDLKSIFDFNTRTIYDTKSDSIKNGRHILNLPTYNSILFPKNDTSWQFFNSFFIDSSDNGYGYFKSIKEWKNVYNYHGQPWPQIDKFPFGIYGTEISQNKHNILYVNGYKKNIKNENLPHTLYFLNYVRTFDYNYAITAVRTTTFPYSDTNRTAAIYTLDYKNNSLYSCDSFLLRPHDFIPDTLKHLKNIGELTKSGISRAHISRNRDYVIINFSVRVIHYSVVLFYRDILFKIRIDPNTLKYIGNPQIVFDYAGTDMEISKKSGVQYNLKSHFNKSIISPNDSIIYLNIQEDKFLNGKIIDSKIKVLAWKYRTESLMNAKTVYLINAMFYKTYSINSSINPYGGLTIYHDSDNYKFQKFIHLQDANNPFLGIKNIQNFTTTSIGYLSEPNHYTYDFVRGVDSIVYKDCGAYVHIENSSDISNGLSEFKWYISKKGKINQWDSFSSFDLPVQFIKESGTYIYKLHGKSYKGNGYSEWFIDTLRVNIPQKPVAQFYAKDTIVCRYKELTFQNLSYSIDSSENNNFLWHFGDGITSKIKNPVHTYQRTGDYTVSLFYSNGFCDSTLVKNQYIKVIDAPKPGFSVSSKQGCAPFEINISDTVVLNVKQKDYFFSDINKWKNVKINEPTFTYRFNTAGVYRVVQRLTGFTGCVTQTDSIYINVSKGLTTFDTLNIINATIENKNTLIYWRKQDAAVKYELFKNGSSYVQTTDTFYYEIIPYTQDAVYTVVAIDSCNNYCSIGREGKPIFLEGNTVESNEVAIINFSPYLNWPTPTIQYKIQKLTMGNWITIQGQQTNDIYSDYAFLEKESLQQCYRIEANDINNPEIISHSNELCIPYNPTIFIPNAFSPNNDGANDIFEPITFGIQKYNIIVFNPWGQEIFKGLDNQTWNGSNAPQGVYLIRLIYITNSGQKLQQNINVTLLR